MRNEVGGMKRDNEETLQFIRTRYLKPGLYRILKVKVSIQQVILQNKNRSSTTQLVLQYHN